MATNDEGNCDESQKLEEVEEKEDELTLGLRQVLHSHQSVSKQLFLRIYNLAYEKCQEEAKSAAAFQSSQILSTNTRNWHHLAGNNKNDDGNGQNNRIGVYRSKLKDQLQDELTKYLNGICDAAKHDNILEWYAENFEKFDSSSKVLNNLLLMLNRNIEETNIKNICLINWVNYVLKPLNRYIFEEIIETIKLKRYQQFKSLKKHMSNFKSLNQNEIETKMKMVQYFNQNYKTLADLEIFNVNSDLYLENFEKRFVEYSKNQYTDIFGAFIKKHCNSVEILSLIANAKELERSIYYPVDTTSSKIIDLIDDYFCSTQRELLEKVFITSVALFDIKNNLKIYQIIQHNKETIGYFSHLFSQRIIKHAQIQIQNILCRALTKLEFTINYFDSIFIIYEKMTDCIAKAYGSCEIFLNVRKSIIDKCLKICEDEIKSKYFKPSKNNAGFVDQILSYFVEMIANKHTTIPKLLNEQQGSQMNVKGYFSLFFDHIESLEKFIELYEIHLKKRLIHDDCFSEEFELQFIRIMRHRTNRDLTVMQLNSLIKEYMLNKNLKSTFLGGSIQKFVSQYSYANFGPINSCSFADFKSVEPLENGKKCFDLHQLIPVDTPKRVEQKFANHFLTIDYQYNKHGIIQIRVSLIQHIILTELLQATQSFESLVRTSKQTKENACAAILPLVKCKLISTNSPGKLTDSTQLEINMQFTPNPSTNYLCDLI